MDGRERPGWPQLHEGGRLVANQPEKPALCSGSPCGPQGADGKGQACSRFMPARGPESSPGPGPAVSRAQRCPGPRVSAVTEADYLDTHGPLGADTAEGGGRWLQGNPRSAPDQSRCDQYTSVTCLPLTLLRPLVK